MRLTIERLRTMVLLAGVLLVVALGVFLGTAKWRNPFNKRDLPQKLGIDIRQEANGWTYTHELHGHILYKIHASKLVQLKQGSHVLLHDVKIEMYGEDGSRTDRIEGSEFEYDPEGGVAKAAGPVEITLMRPGATPAGVSSAPQVRPGVDKSIGSVQNVAAQAAERGQIAVKTSGLTFDRNNGQASTTEKVDFALSQGIGSAIGALYDAHQGRLVLDHAVQLITQRGDETVVLNAQHADFERDEQACNLVGARLGYRDGGARAERAKVFFRDDGTAVKVEGSQGISLTTSAGAQVTAPTGVLEFNEQNEPHQGRLWGGVTLDSDHEGRQLHGTSPTMDMHFSDQGELRSVHLERGVQFTSDEANYAQEVSRTHRTWTSPIADVDFRSAGGRRVEPASIHGTGGVVVTAASRRGDGPIVPSRLVADDMTGSFAPGGGLNAMTGTGHASMSQTNSSGTSQTTSGDKLIAHFLPAAGNTKAKTEQSADSGLQIESATVDGNVVLVQEPAAKAGAPAPAPVRATAGHALYEGSGEFLHLTEDPRIVNGGLELTADKIDVSRASGDAFAHGDVKATWVSDSPAPSTKNAKSANGTGDATFAGEGPAHVVAEEAQLHQATGEATFKGNARLWQQANSIVAPVIVLDRTRQTLTARGTNAADPVQVVLVSAVGSEMGKQPARKQSTPSVIRVRGGDLKYSSAERRALMRGGVAGSVTATTADGNTTSSEVELLLLPPGNHAGKDGTSAQVDRMTSRGHVVVASQGRRGTGDKLVYSNETGNYVLTGTASAPPRITDPTRGTVTGEALIFNGRDDSVSIEGGERRTTTVTTAPK